MLIPGAIPSLIFRILRKDSNVFSVLMRVDSKFLSTEVSSEDLITPYEKERIGVLLLHHGQPRTPYYAKEFISTSSSQYYKVPRPVTSFLTNIFWPFFQKAQFCIADYKKLELMGVHVQKMASSLETALTKLVPEFGPIQCVSAFHYEMPAITRKIKQFLDQGVRRLVLLPLYPHYSCFQTGLMLNTAVKEAYGDVISADNLFAKLRGSEKSDDFTLDSPLVSAIYRWNAHPILFSFWQHLLEEKLDNHDSILFVAPQLVRHFTSTRVFQRSYGARDYKRQVWSSCERLMERLGNTHTWRVAWYSGWNHWPVFNPETVSWQLLLFRKEKKERTLVVPISSVIPSFDTDIVLPNLLVNKGVDLVTPPSFSPLLVNGFAEMIKNHLLGGDIDAQLSKRCPFCVDPRCNFTKKALARNQNVASITEV